MSAMTSTERRFGVAVAGASLSGCATAILLSRAGLRVALIDKHSGPDTYKRLCGHYIQASATPIIRRLGLDAPIEAAGGIRNGVDLWTRWGIIASPEAPEERPHGYSIRRSKLDPLIRRLAIEAPGVEYLQGLEVVGLLGGDRLVTGVELRDRGRRPLRIRCRLVVGADGRNSTVARLAAAGEQRAVNGRFCYMAYFTGVGLPDPRRARFWALDPTSPSFPRTTTASPSSRSSCTNGACPSSGRIANAPFATFSRAFPTHRTSPEPNVSTRWSATPTTGSSSASPRPDPASRSWATLPSRATRRWRSAAVLRSSRPPGWWTLWRPPSAGTSR